MEMRGTWGGGGGGVRKEDDVAVGTGGESGVVVMTLRGSRG